MKDATYRCARAPAEPHVSIHASVKDATDCPRGGCRAAHVSIHASVKDATYSCRQFFRVLSVSIHASVKDATYKGDTTVCMMMFQSTRP